MEKHGPHLETDILIVGGGFAGFSCFRGIARKNQRVTLLTDRNHFLFTPLLPLAAVGTVEVRSIVESVHLYEKAPDEVVIGKAVDIKPEAKELSVRFGSDRSGSIRYQKLILSAGARTNTFNVPGAEKNAYFLKEMKDARKLRETILRRFDKAASLEGAERKAELRFVIVGAGATGVEAACEMQDLIQRDIAKYDAHLAQETEIIILEAAKDILPVFDRTLAAYAQLKLKQKDVILRMESAAKAIEADRILIGEDEVIETRTVLWAAGNGAQNFTQKVAERLEVPLDRLGRLPVDNFLKINGVEDHYAIGDCAACADNKGGFLPQTAQVAMKQGFYMAKIASGKTERPFTFKSMGMLASLGSGAAIADLGFLRFRGMFAWWFWKAAYLTRLVSFRNKLSVAFDWFKVRIFGRSTARIDF